MARSTAQKVVTAKEHSGHTREFLNLARDVARNEGWREYDVFTKWLDAAACSLRSKVLEAVGDRPAWQVNEDRYMKVVHSCRYASETMNTLSHMLAIANIALAQEPKDFLGPIFMEVASNAHVGQFFTPDALSEASARMILDDPRAMLNHAVENEGRQYLSMLEPACGVGGMVLAANRVLREFNLDPGNHVLWTCVDVDWKAVCGCYIQMCLTGTAAVVVHGNTLTSEEWDRLITLDALALVPRSAIKCKEAAE